MSAAIARVASLHEHVYKFSGNQLITHRVAFTAFAKFLIDSAAAGLTGHTAFKHLYHAEMLLAIRQSGSWHIRPGAESLAA